MKILITGATGFIGLHLSRRLVLEGHDLVVVGRDLNRLKEKFPFQAAFFEWDAQSGKFPKAALRGVEAVVHLAGEPVAGKSWTAERKASILETRSVGTKALVDAIATESKGGVLVSASAIGIYGDRGDETVDDSSPPGKDFLADVCVAWEKASLDAPIAERPGSEPLRRVALRIGIVLGREGGALPELLPIFRAGMGGPLGGGRQWMSWIHVDDIVGLILHSIHEPKVKGVVNAVSPHPVTNADFSKALGRALGKMAITPTPAFAIRTMMGDLAQVVLSGQRVQSGKATALGYRFVYPDLAAALDSLDPINDWLTADQWVPQLPEKIWPFFSDAKNLETLTPDFLNFKVTGMSTPTIGNQTLIDYRLRIHGVPVGWQSRIEDWEPGKKFVDTQMKGPYSFWHHTHLFSRAGNGTLMTDRVRYRVPGGVLGQSLLGGKIRRDVEEIFRFRRKKVVELFGAPF